MKSIASSLLLALLCTVVGHNAFAQDAAPAISGKEAITIEDGIASVALAPIVQQVKRKGVDSFLLRCSATLIGPQTFITAAHCLYSDEGALQNDAKLTLWDTIAKLPANVFSAQCSAHPRFRPRLSVTYDIAVCRLAKSVQGIKFEALSLRTLDFDRATNFIMVGYGCRRLEDDDKEILDPRKPAQGSARMHDTQFSFDLTAGGENFLAVSNPEAFLCFGDSGGGVFLNIHERRYGAGSVLAPNRVLVGLNSGLVSTTRGATSVIHPGRISLLVDFTRPLIRDFITSWLEKNSDLWVCHPNYVRNDANIEHCRPGMLFD